MSLKWSQFLGFILRGWRKGYTVSITYSILQSLPSLEKTYCSLREEERLTSLLSPEGTEHGLNHKLQIRILSTYTVAACSESSISICWMNEGMNELSGFLSDLHSAIHSSRFYVINIWVWKPVSMWPLGVTRKFESACPPCRRLGMSALPTWNDPYTHRSEV